MVAPGRREGGGGYADDRDAHVTPPSLREPGADSTATTILDGPPGGNRFSGAPRRPVGADPRVKEQNR
jgi:hypothetical protein